MLRLRIASRSDPIHQLDGDDHKRGERLQLPMEPDYFDLRVTAEETQKWFPKFAAAMDILLRRMRRQLPDLTLRAFADDVASVAPDMRAAAPVLRRLFAEFGRPSGLHLNMPKTCVVPLSHANSDTILQDLLQMQPGWGGIRVASHARYLGFELGPGRGRAAFAKPLAKLEERARWWGAASGGLYLTTVANTAYVASVVSFGSQLDSLPPSWETVESRAFGLRVPGSLPWASPADLRQLRRFGIPRGFVDMQVRQLAAKLRVAHLEGRASGGLDVGRRAARLR